MFPLDPRTVERLAEVVVDIGGPYELKSYQLVELLNHAGWTSPPEYDGSPRIPWLREQLTERRDNRTEIEQFLRRVCDPIQHDDGAVSADAMRDAVNVLLEPEGVIVTSVGGRPVVGELASDGRHAVFSAPPDLRRRMETLIADPVTVDMLMRRVDETVICENGGAYTMAIIGIGSFVEGLLLAVLTERDEDLRKNGFPDVRQRVTPDKRSARRFDEAWVTAELLIDTAFVKDWVQLDATRFAHTVRDFRNFIHPRKELAEQPRFDSDSVTLCWAPVHAILNDLEKNLPAVS